MYYVLQNKIGDTVEYAVLTVTSVYFISDYGSWESDWSVATTDVVEDATKFYSEQEAFNMLAWIDDLPEGVWHPVKLEATL